jgi:uncharacterized protein (DUF58 family)
MPTQLFTEEFLQRLERLSLAVRKATLGQTQGERRSPRRGQSVEFADFRPYVSGDDFRRIDWNAYARLERFFIKLFVEEEDLTLHFIIDASASMRWGQPDKLHSAVQSAGALGYIALTGLDRITAAALGCSARGSIFPPQRGKRQALAFFTFLQGLETLPPAPGKPDPLRALQAYSASVARPGPLVLFSDLMDDNWQPGLRALAGRGFEISLVHILAPDEIEPHLAGDFKLLDSEDHAALEISADYELLSRYQRERSAWQAEWQRFCSARQISYIPISTTLPLDELLFAHLQRKGVLR